MSNFFLLKEKTALEDKMVSFIFPSYYIIAKTLVGVYDKQHNVPVPCFLSVHQRPYNISVFPKNTTPLQKELCASRTKVSETRKKESSAYEAKEALNHTRFERITFRSGVERATVAPAILCAVVEAISSILNYKARGLEVGVVPKG
jgi:hypothetical protein